MVDRKPNQRLHTLKYLNSGVQKWLTLKKPSSPASLAKTAAILPNSYRTKATKSTDWCAGWPLKMNQTQTPLSHHQESDQQYLPLFILSGNGTLWEEGREVELLPGSMVLVRPDVTFQIFNHDDEKLIYLDIIPSITSYFGR